MSQKRGISGLLTSLPDSKRPKTADETVRGADLNEEGNDDYDNSGKGYVQGPLDPVFGQRSAFPVTIDIKGVDLNQEPRDVTEYLAQVRLEACMSGSRRPGHGAETVDDDDDEDYVYYKTTADAGAGADDSVVPKARVDEYMAEFRLRRQEYEDYRMNLHELDAIDLPQTAKQWKKFIWEVSCEKAYVAQIIEEEEHIKLLVYFCKWLSLNVDANFREWLFGVLEAVEEVLAPSEMSVVRQLGKKALRQLQTARETAHDRNMPAVDTYERLLAVVGVFYKQRDLLSGKGASAPIDA